MSVDNDLLHVLKLVTIELDFDFWELEIKVKDMGVKDTTEIIF